jgi:hypothetical protein
MPAPPNSDRITGATRYRTGWFGKLILQVEENVEFYRPAGYCNPSKIISTRWRDARPSDLYLIGWHERAAQAKPEGAPPPPPEHYSPVARGGYQPTAGHGAPKITPTGGSGGRRA